MLLNDNQLRIEQTLTADEKIQDFKQLQTAICIHQDNLELDHHHHQQQFIFYNFYNYMFVGHICITKIELFKLYYTL